MATDNTDEKKTESCCDSGMQAMMQNMMCEKMKSCCPQAEKMSEMMSKCCAPANNTEPANKTEQ